MGPGRRSQVSSTVIRTDVEEISEAFLFLALTERLSDAMLGEW
jgi:hypothetical protein